MLSRGACGSPARIEALADEVRGEGSLLVHAGLGVDAFKQVVARWAYRVDPDADDAKRRAAADDFHFDLAETMDGVHLRGFATPEVGEALSTALAAVIGTPAANDGRSPSRRRHDALATLAQLALSSGGLGTLGAVRPQLVVHVDWRTLIGLPGLTGLDPAVLQESKTPIPRSVLDRIACDSEVTRVVFGPAGQVLDVGRTQRTFTGPRRRALDARDGGCRAPGLQRPTPVVRGSPPPRVAPRRSHQRRQRLPAVLGPPRMGPRARHPRRTHGRRRPALHRPRRPLVRHHLPTSSPCLASRSFRAWATPVHSHVRRIHAYPQRPRRCHAAVR